MKYSVLFDKDASENLNELVRNKIAPHLFVLCNYEPDCLPVFGDDAKFIQGVMNFYKYAHDASLIEQLWNIDKQMGERVISSNRVLFNDLKRITDLISDWRTLYCHNISEASGNDDKRERCQRWLSKAIGKKEIEKLDDYHFALKKLEAEAQRVYEIAKIIICKFSECYADKMKLIATWEDYIIKYYGLPTNEAIIKSQLKLAYMALFNSNGETQLSRELACWCKNMYLQEEQNCRLFEENEQQLQKKLSVEEFSKLREVYEEQKRKISQLKNDIVKSKQKGKSEEIRRRITVESLREFDYLDYYIADVRNKKIREYIPKAIAEGYTMLPQDIIQYIIEVDFEGVSPRT